MNESESRQRLIAEGLKGYLPAVNAVQAFEKEIQESAKKVLISSVPKINEAGGYVDVHAPGTWEIRVPVEGEVALGAGLVTSTRETDSQVRWSGLICGVSWTRDKSKAGQLLSNACCELRLESFGRRAALLSSLSKVDAQGRDANSGETSLTKSSASPGVQVSRPLPAEGLLEQVEQELFRLVNFLVERLAAAGGLREAVCGRAAE
jgi:hypothetical protein